MEYKGSPDEKPAFLDPERADKIPYPGEGSIEVVFDHELEQLKEMDVEPVEKIGKGNHGPSRGYEERYRAIARLHVLGQTNNQIAAKLGYSAPGISLALNRPWVRAEVTRLRQQYETDILSRVKEASLDSAEYLHKTILDDTVKDEIRSANARWMIEKQTGKPKQEVDVKHGLGQFLDVMKEMKERGETIDITPRAQQIESSQDSKDIEQKQDTSWDTWITENV